MSRNTVIFTVITVRTSQLKSKVRSIFRHLYTINKKRQWALSCLSARISAAPSGRILAKFDIQCLWKFVEKLQIWLKSKENIGNFAWRSEYVFIVDSSKICFAARQKCKGNPFSSFHDPTLSEFILLTVTCRSTTIQNESIIAFSGNNDYADPPHCEFYTYLYIV